VNDRATNERAGRADALVALVAVAALVVLLVVFLFQNLGALVLGLLGLGVAVGGAWWALTSRAVRRVAGVVLVVVGAGVIVGALVAVEGGAAPFVLRLVVLAALVTVVSVFARRAMTHHLQPVFVRPRPGGPPRRPVLLCNPRSGGGKVAKFGLVELATELGIATRVLDRGDDLEQLAREAVARGCDCLGMAGGDGSQALVAQIAIEHQLPFVCVSAGTRNHFAMDLGIDVEDPRASVHAFRDAVERQVDYATVNGRLFVNNVSLGVYAQIVHEDAYRDAKVQTTRDLLPEILGRQAEPYDLHFTMPDGREIDGAILVMVSNNPYVLGASPDNAHRRRLDTGQLGVFAVTTRTGAAAARLLTATAIGARRHSAFWHEFAAPAFEVRSGSVPVPAGVDGEACDLTAPLRFEIHARGLTLLVPNGNGEAAERRQARAVTVRNLVRVAGGREPR
jgi:diacylglycerol kinase family enzyme